MDIKSLLVSQNPTALLRQYLFLFSSPEDYDIFIRQRVEESRIQIPNRDEASVTTILGIKNVSGLGGNTIVLRRQSYV